MRDSDWITGPNDERAWDLGHRPDPAAAERVRTFLGRFLRQSKGQWAGRPFELMPWQWERVVRPLFGWKRPDGTRRYRRAYVEIPKKNGKSTLCAALSLYLLVGDQEAGPEVYSAATTRDQAGIVYAEMKDMIGASPSLSRHLEPIPSKKRIDWVGRPGFYRCLSADAPSSEGLNASAVIIDELHAHKSRKLFDSLKYAGAARRSPLAISITTAGFDRTSVCWEQHEYAKGVADGSIEDPSFLGVIFAADPGDDWQDPATWRKANPSLGVTLSEDQFTEDARAAKQSPAEENSFKRYRLNIWTEQETRWLSTDLWDACTGVPEYRGPVYAGLDLASTTDTNSLALWYPETCSVEPFFWVPSETCRTRERLNKQRYDGWIHKGLMVATPGSVVDNDKIREKCNELKKTRGLRKIGADPWNATDLANRLKRDGFKVEGVRQGFGSMSSPTKHLEGLIREAKLRHGGHPIMRWMFSNAAVVMDPAGNVKLSKKAAREKIDGIVALVNGIAYADVEAGLKTGSVYSKRGIEGT